MIVEVVAFGLAAPLSSLFRTTWANPLNWSDCGKGGGGLRWIARNLGSQGSFSLRSHGALYNSVLYVGRGPCVGIGIGLFAHNQDWSIVLSSLPIRIGYIWGAGHALCAECMCGAEV